MNRKFANRLEVGMLIKTSYSEDIYRIEHIVRHCTCSSYLDELEYAEPPARALHIHLECSKPGKPGRFWLNGWDEETLLSLEKTYCGLKSEPDFDHLEILEPDKPVQRSFRF